MIVYVLYFLTVTGLQSAVLTTSKDCEMARMMVGSGVCLEERVT